MPQARRSPPAGRSGLLDFWESGGLAGMLGMEPWDVQAREAMRTGGLMDRMAIAPGFDPGSLGKVAMAGILAGKGARTANLDALARAEDMTLSGSRNPDVWEETGWYRDPADKFYRFEIPDTGARLDPEMVQEAIRYGNTGKYLFKPPTLGDVLIHPELFQAYPQLRTMPLEIKKLAEGMRGQVGTIEDAQGNIVSNVIRLNKEMKEPQMLSTLLHEVQHGVQDIEGFARGGNMREFLPWQRQYDEFKGNIDSTVKRMDNLYIGMREARDRAEAATNPADAEKAQLRFEKLDRELAVQKDYLRFMENEIAAMRKASGYAPIHSAYEMYRNLAGEIEARNVQARHKLGIRGFPADPRQLDFWPTVKRQKRGYGAAKPPKGPWLTTDVDPEGYRPMALKQYEKSIKRLPVPNAYKPPNMRD